MYNHELNYKFAKEKIDKLRNENTLNSLYKQSKTSSNPRTRVATLLHKLADKLEPAKAPYLA